METEDPFVQDEELEILLDNPEADREAMAASYRLARKLGLDDVAETIAGSL